MCKYKSRQVGGRTPAFSLQFDAFKNLTPDLWWLRAQEHRLDHSNLKTVYSFVYYEPQNIIKKQHQ